MADLMRGLGSPEREDLASICERLTDELSTLAGRRLLITGGAGFLGYYLVRTVLWWNAQHPESPIDLVVLDNFRLAAPAWLAAADEGSHVTVRRHDVTGPLPDDLAEPDFIIHAASIASPTFYRRHPIATMDANVRGLRRLLDHCRERADAGRPVAGFLFFSTSEIYGDPTPGNVPTPETYPGHVSSVGPRACYDESKRYGETLAVSFHAEHGVPVRIVRPFNNYGPGLRLDDGRLVSDLASSVLAGEDILMYSDGSPTRTFCYVADAIVGYYRVLVRGRDAEPYNIGADRPEISVAEVAERVAAIGRELFDYGGQVVRRVHDDRQYLTDNPQRRCPVIDKARREVGFEPTVSLGDGLRRTLAWYRIQKSSVGEVSNVG